MNSLPLKRGPVVKIGPRLEVGIHVPLANQSGAIPGGPQSFLIDREPVVGHRVEPVVAVVPVHGGVLPGHQRGPGGRAEGAVDERVAKIDTLPGDALVEVGRLDERVPGHAQSVVPEVIDVEQENVRTRRLLRGDHLAKHQDGSHEGRPGRETGCHWRIMILAKPRSHAGHHVRFSSPPNDANAASIEER